MSTKTMKILTMIVSIVLVVLMGGTTVFAATLTPNDINSNADVDTKDIADFGSKILTILTSVGAIIAVIILAVLGIKYLMGSAEEKADFKKAMIPYIVGAICVFMAPAIANAVYNLVKA